MPYRVARTRSLPPGTPVYVSGTERSALSHAAAFTSEGAPEFVRRAHTDDHGVEWSIYWEDTAPTCPRGAHLSSADSGGSDVWLTPPEVLDPIRSLYTIRTDPCTEPNNPVGAEYYWSPGGQGDGPGNFWGTNGLSDVAWQTSAFTTAITFVNPPYSRIKQDWGPKIIEQARMGVPIITLLPSRTDRQWFRDLYSCSTDLDGDCYLWPGRLRFVRGDGTRAGQAPYPSVLFSFNCTLPSYDGGLYV